MNMRIVDDMPERKLYYAIAKAFREKGAKLFAGSNFLDADGQHIKFHAHATGLGYLIAHTPDYSRKAEIRSVKDAMDFNYVESAPGNPAGVKITRRGNHGKSST